MRPLELLPVPAGAAWRAETVGADPSSEPAKSPTAGGLGGPVYSLKNELSISPGRGSAPRHPGPGSGESTLEDEPLSREELPAPIGHPLA